METLTRITKPVNLLVLPGRVIEVQSDSWKIQEDLGCHAWKIVDATCFAVKLTKTRQTDPGLPFYNRMILDWEKGHARLAKLMAKYGR